MFLDSGFSLSAGREFARKDVDSHYKGRVFMTLEKSYLFIIFIPALFIFIFSEFIAKKWLNLDNINVQDVSFYLKIISLEIGLQMLFRYYFGVMMGLEKHVHANLFQFVWGVLRNGAVILLIYFLPDLSAFFVWQLAVTLLLTFSLRYFVKKNYITKGDYGFDKSIFRAILPFTFGILSQSVISSVNTQLDKLTISKKLPISELGNYTLAMTVAMGVVILVNPISMSVLPRFTAYFSRKNHSELKNLYLKNLSLTLIIVIAVLVNVYLYAFEILYLWTHDETIAKNAYRLLKVMIISYSFLAIATVPYNITIAAGKTKFNNIMGLASLLITIPGYLIAIEKYSAIGAAIVFCIVQTLITFFYFLMIHKKYFNNHKFAGSYYLKISGAFILTFTVTFLISKVVEGASLYYYVIIIPFSVMLSLLIMGLFLFDKKEIKNFISKINFRRKIT